MTLTRILCPVDFSESSDHAVDHAVAVARWYRAQLMALHVCSPAFVPVPALPPPAERVSDRELQEAREHLRVRFAVATSGGLEPELAVRIGQPAEQILAQAAEWPADLIVMGTHGASGFEHLVLGSVTEKVLRKAPCAVLTVPHRARTTSSLPFRTVLCAVDFSDWSAAALRLAASISAESGAALILLHVIEWPWPEPPAPDFAELPAEQARALADYRHDTEKQAESRLQALASGVAGAGRPPAARVKHGKAYAEILRLAADEHADLIVLGVHGRNALDLAVFGSTTNHIVRDATCPVMTLRR